METPTPRITVKTKDYSMDSLCTQLGITNPWPKERPTVPTDDHSWFINQSALREYVEPSYLVLELGAWLGGSTRFLADLSSFVITIDHWLGSVEHQLGEGEDVRDKLPTLYETFITNCWERRDKILPLRMTTHEGMRLLLDRGVIPDLIYVDADHSYKGCTRDLKDAFRFGRNTVITGDDWNWGEGFPVRRAAIDFARSHGMTVVASDNFWGFGSGSDLFRSRNGRASQIDSSRLALDDTIARQTKAKLKVIRDLKSRRAWFGAANLFRTLFPSDSRRYAVFRSFAAPVRRTLYHSAKKLIRI